MLYWVAVSYIKDMVPVWTLVPHTDTIFISHHLHISMWGGHSPQLLGIYDFISFIGGRDREEYDWLVLMFCNFFFIITLL